ncbi:HWE histidine kinase domain-containing protein [Gymnodinialimonas sp. 57CJ19]|uniref:HWE histidine kinase domain-containing protein n=1 Tax=Gymnodinialimonas sp. 57CJ19 TaxID=3138498 RepID=UPI0031346353
MPKPLENEGDFPSVTPQDHEQILGNIQRLSSLARTGLMDSDKEEGFDRLSRLASRLLDVPVSLVSLVDDNRQFFKAEEGLQGPVAQSRETPLSHSFCQYVVTTEQSLSVVDAREHPLLSDNGAIKDLNVIAYLGEPLHAPNGAVIGSFCAISDQPRTWTDEDRKILRDVTGLAEDQMRLQANARRNLMLVEEMSHRLKNLFTVSSSLLRLSAREAEDKASMVKLLEGRITALARSHNLALGKGRDNTNGLKALLNAALAPYADAVGLEVQLSGPPLDLSPEAVTYIALTFHELATNAAKYGALSRPGGALHVTWNQTDEGIELFWEERAEVENLKASSGFGSDLLNDAVQFGLGGELQRDLKETGIHYRITLPGTVLNNVSEA